MANEELESTDSYKDKNIITKTRDICEYKVEKEDLDNIILIFRILWQIELIEFNEINSWPYLFIFKENHWDWQVKKENFEAFVKNREYFNFLSTEWTNEKLFRNIDSFQNNFLLNIDLILSWWIDYSSQSVNLYLWNDFDVYWVDLSEKKLLNRLKYKDEIFKVKLKKWMTPDEYISKRKRRLEKWERKLEKYSEKVLIHKRNIIWLNNISKLLKSWNNYWSWKNFIPIICWWNHASWLAKEAKKHWFKWVITFSSTSYS